MLGKPGWPWYLDGIRQGLSGARCQKQREHNRRVHVCEIRRREYFERSQHRVQIVALVSQLFPVSIGEWHFDLHEEDLPQRLAKIFRHIRIVGELIDALALRSIRAGDARSRSHVDSRLCSAAGLRAPLCATKCSHAILGLGVGNLSEVRLVPFSAEHRAHATEY